MSIDEQSVAFHRKDYAQGNRPGTTTLDGAEFLRRFLLHAVPAGFMRIRHFGLLANRVRAKNLATCRQLLAAASVPPPVTAATPGARGRPCCPICGRGRLVAGPTLSPEQLGPLLLRLDSS